RISGGLCGSATYGQRRNTGGPMHPTVRAKSSLPLRGAALLALSLALGACAMDVTPPDDERGDDVPELRLAGEELEERFTREGDLSLSPVITLESGANRVALMARLAEGAEAPQLLVRGVDGDHAGGWQDAAWT